jgi:hypothetical protein
LKWKNPEKIINKLNKLKIKPKIPPKKQNIPLKNTRKTRNPTGKVGEGCQILV